MRAAHPLVVAVLCAVPLGATAGSPHPPIFRAEARVVNLTVSVLDTNKKNVAGLSIDDFVVYEGSEQQTLEPTMFGHERLPFDLTLLVDQSKSMTGLMRETKRAAVAFLASLMAPGDEAQIIGFGANDQTLQDFTADQQTLHAAIQQIAATENHTNLRVALYAVSKNLLKRPPADQRRQVILLISDGQDSGSLVDEERTIQALHMAHATLLAIEVSSSPLRENDRDDRPLLAHEMLERMTAQTGGTLIRLGPVIEPGGGIRSASVNISGAYRKIAEELRSQYRIGYRPTRNPPKGEWRDIVVHIRRPNTTVRCRSGYYVPGK